MVADAGTQQGNIATVRIERALVDHAAVTAAGKLIVAGHKVTVAEIQGRGHQAADIDRSTLPEQHAIGVDQENLTVGIEVTQNARGVGTQYPVERNCAAVGLSEVHRFAFADIEALPVDADILRGLVNGRATGTTADAGTAGRHLASRRQGVDIEPGSQHHAGSEGFQSETSASAQVAFAGTGGFLAAALGVLGCRNKSAALGIPDRLVNIIHGVFLLCSGVFAGVVRPVFVAVANASIKNI